MYEYAVHFEIRKGLGPDYFPKTIFIGLDDIDPDLSNSEIKALAKNEAEQQLKQTEDYLQYGKNWVYKTMERI
jgi:hypothetical protein